ncbi:hypothetical protein BGZ82_004712, partial [Podila clonocystis]
DLRVDIKKITDKFFASGSPIADFLDAYVQGEKRLPVTTTGIKGLPKVQTFSSVLEGMQAQDLPVFGVSWGFYFNASKNDLGSDDLSLLARSIDDKVLQEQ